MASLPPAAVPEYLNEHALARVYASLRRLWVTVCEPLRALA